MDPFAAFAAELRGRRKAAGLTQDELAALAHYPTSGRSIISKAENGRELPSPDFVDAVDKALAVGGVLVELRRAARAAELRGQADDLTGSPALVDESAGTPALWSEHAAMVEEDATDRRQLIQAGGLTAAATVQALAERIATADPTPLRRAQIAADVQRASEARATAPRAQLRAQLEPEHLRVEALLDRRLSRKVREELATYAGLYAYFLGWLARGTGDDDAAVAYATLCSHHADETRDPMLLGAAAELRSSLTASVISVEIAGRAWRDPAVDPYVRPFLAAKEARAAARLRLPDRAHEALTAMESTVWTGAPQPGPLIFDEEACHAWLGIVLVELGQGEAAEGHARSSLRLLVASDAPYLAAGTLNMLARSFLRRKHPDPEQAADATEQALALLMDRPSRSGIEAADQAWRKMAARWPDLAAVHDLGEQVAEARRALSTSRPALT
jgi:transcriptional regulator with XRE-family HTH domain